MSLLSACRPIDAEYDRETMHSVQPITIPEEAVYQPELQPEPETEFETRRGRCSRPVPMFQFRSSRNAASISRPPSLDATRSKSASRSTSRHPSLFRDSGTPTSVDDVHGAALLPVITRVSVSVDRGRRSGAPGSVSRINSMEESTSPPAPVTPRDASTYFTFDHFGLHGGKIESELEAQDREYQQFIASTVAAAVD